MGEDHRAHTGLRPTEVEGVADDHPHLAEDGEEGAEEEGEEDEEAAILGTDLVRTRDPGAGVRAEACPDPRTAAHLQGHHHAEEEAEGAVAEESRRREEGEGVAVAAVAVVGGAQVMIHTIARGLEAEVEIADSVRHLSWLHSST